MVMPRMVTFCESLMAMVFGPPRFVRFPSTAASPVIATSCTHLPAGTVTVPPRAAAAGVQWAVNCGGVFGDTVTVRTALARRNWRRERRLRRERRAGETWLIVCSAARDILRHMPG